jgi:lysophospholipase L1-like esterase
MKLRWLSRHEKASTINPSQMAAFLQTIEAFRKAGTTVVIIAAPLHPIARTTPWMRQIAEQIRAAVPRDVPVADYSGLLEGDEYFEDPIHLNAAGRRAFEPYLVEILGRTGRLRG